MSFGQLLKGGGEKFWTWSIFSMFLKHDFFMFWGILGTFHFSYFGLRGGEYFWTRCEGGGEKFFRPPSRHVQKFLPPLNPKMKSAQKIMFWKHWKHWSILKLFASLSSVEVQNFSPPPFWELSKICRPPFRVVRFRSSHHPPNPVISRPNP